MIFIIVFGIICVFILFVQMFIAALNNSSRTSRGEKIFYFILILVGFAILTAIVI